jgi:hypothetical protein
MSRRARIRKRNAKKRKYAQHPKQITKPVSQIKTSGLFADLARPLSSRALSEAIEELQTAH